jgi:hypothetical protein
LDLENLVAGLNETAFQPADFILELGFGEVTFTNAMPATVNHKEPAAAYAGRNRNAPEDLLSLL